MGSTLAPPMVSGRTEQHGVNKSNLNTSSKTIYNVSPASREICSLVDFSPSLTFLSLLFPFHHYLQLISNASEMPEDRLPLFCSEYRSCPTPFADLNVELSFSRWLCSRSSRSIPFSSTFCRFDSLPSVGRYFHLGSRRLWHLEESPDLISRLPKGWEAAAETAKDKGPENYCKLDASEAEKQLGLKFKGWEQTLEENLQSLLKLEKTEGWNWWRKGIRVWNDLHCYLTFEKDWK